MTHSNSFYKGQEYHLSPEGLMTVEIPQKEGISRGGKNRGGGISSALF